MNYKLLGRSGLRFGGLRDRLEDHRGALRSAEETARGRARST